MRARATPATLHAVRRSAGLGRYGRELAGVAFDPRARGYPYRCLLRDGRCVLVSGDLRRHTVLVAADRLAVGGPLPSSARELTPQLLDRIRQCLGNLPR